MNRISIRTLGGMILAAVTLVAAAGCGGPETKSATPPAQPPAQNSAISGTGAPDSAKGAVAPPVQTPR